MLPCLRTETSKQRACLQPSPVICRRWLTVARVPDSHRGDGVYRRVLDTAVSDSGATRLGGVSGQRSLPEECSRTQERCFRLSVDPVSSLGWSTQRELPAAGC